MSFESRRPPPKSETARSDHPFMHANFTSATPDVTHGTGRWLDSGSCVCAVSQPRTLAIPLSAFPWVSYGATTGRALHACCQSVASVARLAAKILRGTVPWLSSVVLLSAEAAVLIGIASILLTTTISRLVITTAVLVVRTLLSITALLRSTLVRNGEHGAVRVLQDNKTKGWKQTLEPMAKGAGFLSSTRLGALTLQSKLT